MPVRCSAEEIVPKQQERFISDRRLRNELITIVIIKVFLLTMIWWFFFRDNHVVVQDRVPTTPVVTDVQNGDGRIAASNDLKTRSSK